MPNLPDISSAQSLGATSWADYQPITDPTTEISADILKEIAVNSCAATHTVSRAIVSFQCATYTSGSQSITVIDSDAVWGNLALVLPTVVQTSAGVYVITWPESLHDELGGDHTVNIRFPHNPVVIGSTYGSAMVVSKTAHSITIQAYDIDCVPDSLNGDTIVVSWS